jgi:hypothetical protein
VEPLESLVARLPGAAPPAKTAREARGAKASAARKQLSLFDD